MFGHYTYLLIDLLSVLFPFLLSFDKKVAFFKQWKGLFSGIAVTGAGFVIWDIWFTANGVWSFNPDYITGLYLANLPIEEVLFFVCVPYSSVFIYACYRQYFSLTLPEKGLRIFLGTLACALMVMAFLYQARWYTFFNFLFGALLLFYHSLWLKPNWLSAFVFAYLIHLIPFFIVNGFLTAIPVVIYNDAHNLGIRLGSVPIEDTVYSLVLMLGVTSIMEKVQPTKTTR